MLGQQHAGDWLARGGQSTSPNEQKTQQSPAFGRKSVPHPTHSKKYKQALVGIVSTETCPHTGTSVGLSDLMEPLLDITDAEPKPEVGEPSGRNFAIESRQIGVTERPKLMHEALRFRRARSLPHSIGTVNNHTSHAYTIFAIDL